MIDRVLTGGFPEAVGRRPARRPAWFQAYVTTVTQNVVRDLAAIERLAELPRLLRLCAAAPPLNGTLDSASASIAVQARDWAALDLKFTVEEFTPANLPSRPTRVGELGNFAGFAAAFFPPADTVPITAGPNAGLLYFTEVPVEGLARIQINRVALSLGSQFYVRQRPDRAPPLQGVCQRADVLPFLPLVEAHEGLNFESLSHAGVYRSELNRLVPQATESIVGLGTTLELLELIQSLAQSRIDSAQALARDSINGGLVPPVPYCDFRYFK